MLITANSLLELLLILYFNIQLMIMYRHLVGMSMACVALEMKRMSMHHTVFPLWIVKDQCHFLLALGQVTQ